MAEYIGDCVRLPKEFLDSLDEVSKPISYSTFVKNVGLAWLEDIFPFYAWGRDKGLKLKNDYAVYFEKARVKNVLYYIAYHSQIHHVFAVETSKERGKHLPQL